jgi:hypothetical protein
MPHNAYRRTESNLHYSMTEQKKHLAIAVLVIWLVLVLLFMVLSRTLNIEIFFVLWLLGLLVIVEFIGPSYVRPPYLRYLRYLITAGIVIFGAIVAEKVMEILNS